ncbi:hypothetical protein V3C99_015378 [Haemonchus contortus]
MVEYAALNEAADLHAPISRLRTRGNTRIATKNGR